MKQEGKAPVIEAIRAVATGKVYVSRAVNDRRIELVARRRGDPSPLARRSDRELERRSSA
jgi:hypothetical protein